MILDENFVFRRPLAVTCHIRIGREVDHHEMVVDRVENGDYVLQNTATANQSELRIEMNKIPHVDWNEYHTYPPKTNKVVTDEYGMNESEWYVSRTAFSVQIKLP